MASIYILATKQSDGTFLRVSGTAYSSARGLCAAIGLSPRLASRRLPVRVPMGDLGYDWGATGQDVYIVRRPAPEY